MNHMRAYRNVKVSSLFSFIGILLLASCSSNTKSTKQFVWDGDLAELTGKNLYVWLQKAPFDNELKRHEKDKIVFTNAEQVFPFKGRYYNTIEELRTDHDAAQDTIIYQEAELLFQDSLWGDLFLQATLLYDNQEVFLNDSYVEIGNLFFGGTDAVTDTHSASLYETGAFARHPSYKTGIYWASANFTPYLLGFYQKGQLIFETAIPLLRGDTLATLNKLKEVNHDLGLRIPEWENATVDQLRRVDDAKSFYEDPFKGIYLGPYAIDQVYLKTKNTPFTQADTATKGDYYFSYQSPSGLVEFYTVLQKTEMDMDSFNQANEKMNHYHYNYQNIFYEEESADGYVSGTAKTYFKDKEYLQLHYYYPQADREAKEYVHDVLKYIKVISSK